MDADHINSKFKLIYTFKFMQRWSKLGILVAPWWSSAVRAKAPESTLKKVR